MSVIANQPEKPHFDRIFLLEQEIAERKIDISELYKAAKEADVDVKLLKRAIRLALEDDDKKKDRRELEGKAEALLAALGAYADSPLGEAAVRAAQ